MKASHSKLLNKFLSAFLLVFVSSCASAPVVMTVPAEINIESPQIANKIPLRAALYISPGMRTLKAPSVAVQGGTYIRYDISIGDVFADSMEKIARCIFQEVILLDPMGGAAGLADKKYDVIVTPELKTMDNSLECFFPPPTLLARAALKWTIVTLDGKEIYVNTIKSDEIKVHKRFGQKTQQEGIALILKDLFQKSQQDIYASGWWKTNR